MKKTVETIGHEEEREWRFGDMRETINKDEKDGRRNCEIWREWRT